MRKIKTVFWSLTATILLILTFVPAQRVEAQSGWGFGASFEMRDNDPSNGFGLRVERGILSGLPLVDLKLRAHFSFFSENVTSFRDIPGSGMSSADLEVYDFGLAATGGINIGLLSPYVGAGLGSENFRVTFDDNFRVTFDDIEGQSFSDRNNSIYWNLYGGVSVPILPLFKPFVEYRFTRLFDAEEFDYNHNSRFAIGFTLDF